MGLLFNDNNEINEKVKNEFGNLDNHLIAFKHNGIKKGLAKLLIIGGVYYTFDSNRTFILYFSNKGIYEEEMSNSCLLYTSPSPRDISGARMPSSA